MVLNRPNLGDPGDAADLTSHEGARSPTRPGATAAILTRRRVSLAAGIRKPIESDSNLKELEPERPASRPQAAARTQLRPSRLAS
jgi:hypothetical protein